MVSGTKRDCRCTTRTVVSEFTRQLHVQSEENRHPWWTLMDTTIRFYLKNKMGINELPLFLGVDLMYYSPLIILEI
jgi:hypothetical protein